MKTEELLESEISSLSSYVLKSGFLTTLPSEMLPFFLLSLQKLTISAGETLFSEGENDEDPSFFLVLHGRLRVYSKQNEGIADILGGQIIGELAPLIHTSRSHKVRAARDSILLKFDQKAYRFLEKNCPLEIIYLSKLALNRLHNRIGNAYLPGERVKAITVIPAGHTNCEEFYKDLKAHLNDKYKACLLLEADFNEKFKHGLSSPQLEGEAIAWLSDVEEQCNFLIFVGDGDNSSWTQLAIHSADRVIIVAEDQKNKSLNDTEKYLFSLENIMKPYTDLVILHPADLPQAKHVSSWLKHRPVDLHHNIRKHYQPHMQRLVRFLTGKAVGVVLSGGGGKAVAHLGVLKALEELNVAIDFIAGTSMGAVIAAGYATFGLEKSFDINHDFILNYKSKPTLPLQSFFTGALEENMFQDEWGDTCIEDLWTHFFCVASDIEHYKVKILQKGEIWKALRSTISLPAIFPPICTEEGEVLVDGGVLNNMPVDIMRQFMSGGFILAVNCNTLSKRTHTPPKRTKYSNSGWRILMEKYNPFAKEIVNHLSIVSIMAKTIYAATINKQKQLEELADIVLHIEDLAGGVINFSLYESNIERGYKQAMEILQYSEIVREESKKLS